MFGTEEEEDDDDSVRAVAVVFSRAVWPPPSPVPVAIRPSCIPADRQTGVPPPARRPRAHALLSKTPTLSYAPSRYLSLSLFLLPPSIYLSVFFPFLSVWSTEARARSCSFCLSFSPCFPSLFSLCSSSCAHALAILLSFYYYAPRAGQRRLSVPKLHRLFQPNIGISHNSDITHARGKMSPARIINLLSAGSKKIER